MNILIVEDGVPMAKAMASILEADGNKVTIVIGFESLEPTVALGLTGEHIPMNPRDFHLVLCDGSLKGKFKGAEIVKHFTGAKVDSLGMSSMPTDNAAMVANGASLAWNKAVMFFILLSKRYSLSDMRFHGMTLQGLEAGLIKELLADGPLKAQAEALLQSFSEEKE